MKFGASNSLSAEFITSNAAPAHAINSPTGGAYSSWRHSRIIELLLEVTSVLLVFTQGEQ